MASPRLSLRDRLIVAGLLRPADPDEKSTAHQRFSVYLQTVARTGIRARSTLDIRLTLAVLVHALSPLALAPAVSTTPYTDPGVCSTELQVNRHSGR
jgi:hypothetical protein